MRNVLGTLVIALVLVLNASVASATSLSFLVTVDTSSLIGGTYYLDFLLTDGNAASNTVEISDVAGVDPVGASLTLGSASGDLSSTVTLNDSAPDFGVVDFFQQFTPSGVLSFLVTISREFVDAVPPAASIPDQFSFSILDDTFLPIVTSDPLGVGRLLALDISGPDVTLANVESFSGLQPVVSLVATAPTDVSAVPEPASLLLFGGGLAAAGARRWRQRR